MVLDLSKAAFFFLCILSLYRAAIHAFFIPGTRWQERMIVALVYLTFAASVCVFSGLLFSWPVESNPDRGQRLLATLPVRLFLWSSLAIAALFISSWYLGGLAQQAGPFISDRFHDR